MSLGIDNLERVPITAQWGDPGGIFAFNFDDFFFGWEGPYSTGAASRWLMYFDRIGPIPNGQVPPWSWQIMGGPATALARVDLSRMGWKPIKPLIQGRLILSSTSPALTVLASGTIGSATTILGRRSPL